MIRNVTAALLLSAGIGLPAAAKNLNYAHGYPADSTVGKAAVTYANTVEEKSGAALKVKPFAMSLLSLSETGPGLRDRMADIGYILTPYYSAEYVTSLLLHEINLLVNLGQDKGIESFAYAGAIADYTLNSCPEYQAEFSAQNQVYTGTGGDLALWVAVQVTGCKNRRPGWQARAHSRCGVCSLCRTFQGRCGTSPDQ